MRISKQAQAILDALETREQKLRELLKNYDHMGATELANLARQRWAASEGCLRLARSVAGVKS